MDSNTIIIEPVVTEKSNKLKEVKKYIFKVDARANKFQIKKALLDLYNVHTIKCCIINVKPKPKRVRYKKGHTSNWKKAIVTLLKDEAITIFEGA